MNESCPLSSGSMILATSHIRIVSHQPAEERILRADRAEPSSSTISRTSPPSTVIRCTPARSRNSPPSSLNRCTSFLRIIRMPRDRPGEPLLKNAAEQNTELAKLHVPLARAAVEHDRAKQHLDQQRIADRAADDVAGRRPRFRRFDPVVIENLGLQAAEIVDLAGKILGDLGLQQRRVVVKIERHAGERDPRSELRGEPKILPGESQVGGASGRAGRACPPSADNSSPRAGRHRSSDGQGDSTNSTRPRHNAAQACKRAVRNGPAEFRPPARTCPRR